MKYLLNILTSVSFLSLTIFIACGGGDGGDDGSSTSARQVQAEKLQGTWAADFSSNENAITFDGQGRAEDWSGFTLNITNATESGGSFTTSGAPSGDGATIWPSSGSWSFTGDGETVDSITRGGEVLTISSVTDTQLVIKITITDPNARIDGFFDLEWTFTLTKQ